MKNAQQIVLTAVVLSIGSAFGLESYFPTEGLQYHVDVTQSASLTRDTQYSGYENHVVEWRSDVGSVKLLSNAYDSPIYFADAFGTGKPGLRFGLFDDETSRPQSMYGNTATTNRTVVYVMKVITPVNCMELFGAKGLDYGFRMNADGSHYPDSHNAGGVSWVNGYAWQPTAYPAKGSALVYETQVCIDAAPDSIGDVAPTKASTGYNAGTYFTSKIAFYDGASMTARRYTGYFGEIAVYDRQLTDAERAALTLGLMRKWCPEKVNTWIGGTICDWGVAANWSAGEVPDATSVAVFTNQTVTIKGTANAALLVLENVQMTVEGHARLTYGTLAADAASSVTQENLIPSWMPTEGLQFRMNAADIDSLTYDAKTLQVSTWKSDIGLRQFNVGGNYPPHYIADAFGTGRAGLRFGYDDEGNEDAEGGYTMRKLVMDAATTNRTLVYVVKTTKGVGCMEVMGANGLDWGLRFNASAQHYADSFTTGGWGYVNGYNWLTPTGSTAYPAATDSLCYETQVCVDVRPDGAEDIAVVKSGSVVANGTIFTIGLGHYDCIGGGTYGKRFYRGYVGELLAYSRRLGENERNYLTAKLMQKWRPDDVRVWVGGGDTSDWSDATNWQGGNAPTASSVVILGTDASVSGTVAAQMLVFDDNAKLTLADGTVWQVVGTCGPENGAYAVVAAGDVRVAAAAGTTVNLVGRFSGGGRLVKTGAGSLSVSADNVFNGFGLDLSEGTLDLLGTRQCFTALTGDNASVTNSSATQAELTMSVGSGRTAEFELPIRGNVKVVKTGAGTANVGAGQAYSGATEIEGGTLVARDVLYDIDSMAGVVIHADASRSDTLTYDAQTLKVSQWDSTKAGCTYIAQSTEDLQPTYVPSAAGGRGGILFGQSSATYMSSHAIVSNVTVCAVISPAATQTSDTQFGCFIGNSWSENGLRTTGKTNPKLDGQVYGRLTGNGKISLNGLPIYDGGAVTTGNVPGTNTVLNLDQPNVIVAVCNPEVKAVLFPTESPVNRTSLFNTYLGQYYFATARYFTGCFHEVLIFDRKLSDEEVKLVSATLMRRWGVNAYAQPNPKDTLSAKSPLVVRSDATLDFSVAPQTAIPSVTFDADGTSAYPLLSVLGDWDFTRASLTLTNQVGGLKRQTLVSGGNLTGPFQEAEVPHASAKIRYKTDEVLLSVPQGLTVIFR